MIFHRNVVSNQDSDDENNPDDAENLETTTEPQREPDTEPDKGDD
jgi:hypothetical protein